MSEANSSPLQDPDLLQQSRSLEFARKNGDKARILSALSDLGQTYLKAGDAPKALTQFEEGIVLATDLGDGEEEARLWGYKGMALKSLGNYKLALSALNNSNRLARDLSYQVLEADSLFQIGQLQAEQGDLSKGISKVEQAYAIAVERDDYKRMVNMAMVLGNYFFGLDAAEKAVEYFMESLTQARQKKDRPVQCSVLVAIGNVQLSGKEFEGATESFETALSLASALEQADAQIAALTGLMKANVGQGKIDLAEMYGDRALDLSQSMKNREAEAAIVDSLAGLLLGQSEYKPAISHLERGKVLAEEQKDGPRILSMLTGLAFAHYSLDKVDEAQALYEEMLDESRRYVDKIAESTSLGRLSAIYYEKGNEDQALELAKSALEVALESENLILVAEQQILLALTLQDLGKPEQADSLFEEAIQTYRGIGEEDLVVQAEALRQKSKN